MASSAEVWVQKAASALLAEEQVIVYFDLYYFPFSTYMRAIRNLGAKVVKKNDIYKKKAQYSLKNLDF